MGSTTGRGIKPLRLHVRDSGGEATTGGVIKHHPSVQSISNNGLEAPHGLKGLDHPEKERNIKYIKSITLPFVTTSVLVPSSNVIAMVSP